MGGTLNTISRFFYYAVVKYWILEKYGKKEIKKRIICLRNFLLLKLLSLKMGEYEKQIRKFWGVASPPPAQ